MIFCFILQSVFIFMYHCTNTICRAIYTIQVLCYKVKVLCTDFSDYVIEFVYFIRLQSSKHFYFILDSLVAICEVTRWLLLDWFGMHSFEFFIFLFRIHIDITFLCFLLFSIYLTNSLLFLPSYVVLD